MAMITFNDEKELQRKICTILNKFGYNFQKEKDTYFCDIVERTHHLFCEVKPDGEFAPQQILYGIIKDNEPNPSYIALANEYELRIYRMPNLEKVTLFAKSISKDLSISPSAVPKKFETKAFEILGDHIQIYGYTGDFKIDTIQPYVFFDKNNLEYFQEILIKYRIYPSIFINTFASTFANNSKLYIKNDNRTIFDMESGKSIEARVSIKNAFDKVLIQSMRILPQNINEMLHKMDELSPLDYRRKRGKFWTNLDVSEKAYQIIREKINPTIIVEPFAGSGSLIADFIEIDKIKIIMNDIDTGAMDLLKQKWNGYNISVHKDDVMAKPIAILMKEWEIDTINTNETFLVYSNPPFGTSNTNGLASTKEEIETMDETQTKSRKIKITYGAEGSEAKWFEKTYGKGDLCIASISHMIEMVKRKGTGYLAFFSPFGVLLGRSRYNKILDALLKDFEFIHGEVYSGDQFNGVNKSKAISLSLWNYHPNVNTKHKNLKFQSNDKTFNLKEVILLKDGWKYDTRKNLKNEIVVNPNSYFSLPSTKRMLHLKPEKGGSEIIPENIILDLNISNIPSELLYAMWSMTVGYKAIYEMPFVFNEANVHLPNFNDNKVLSICTYTIMYALITELKNNNCEGKIGFVPMSRIFCFGGKELTKGVEYLIKTYSHLPIGNKTIQSVFESLKNGQKPDEIDSQLRIFIKQEIESRLDEIGYWNFIPIPKHSDYIPNHGLDKYHTAKDDE